MAKEDTNQAGTPSVMEKGLGMLERAWDAQWALRLVCILLFFDIAMLLHVHRGLWQWAEVEKTVLNDVGWLAVTLVAFSFAAAIVVPVLLIVLRQLLVAIVGLLPAWLRGPDAPLVGRPVGYVPLYEFRKLALREKDDFLLRMYEMREQQLNADKREIALAGDLTAAALLIALADWILAQRIPAGVGLIDVLANALGNWASLVVALVLLCAGTILKWAWFSPHRLELIHYPPLDTELRHLERKARDMASRP